MYTFNTLIISKDTTLRKVYKLTIIFAGNSVFMIAKNPVACSRKDCNNSGIPLS